MKSTGWLWWGFQPQIDRICFQILLMLNIETCAQKEKAKKKKKKRRVENSKYISATILKCIFLEKKKH